MNFKIIGCPEWGAISPRGGFNSIIWTPKPADEIIIHHTAGHHPEISLPNNESHLEALMYVRAIQHSHMSPSPTDPSKPWKDSGQNFTVMRNGEIYHAGHEEMTLIQKEASAWLQAWIALNYGKKDPLKANPHSKYINTSCPVNLVDDIGDIRDRANWLMDHQSV
jgi:hypothetical protein